MNLLFADRVALGLPLLPPLPNAPEPDPTNCYVCEAALGEDARAGRCPTCNARARGMYYAGVFAASARNGMVVNEGITETFAQYLPAALARRGFHLEREALAWVVRR
jgi:hypothetical protein